MYEIINCHATYTKQGDAATQLDEQPIYGSSRLGVFRGSAATEGIVRGTRVYEASNHLGNVLLTFSDKKVAQPDGSYKADVTSASDYYAFGMTALGREFKGEGYRFGFNGKEHDKEITNDDYDFGARIYDGRIGRWLSLDPSMKKYPNLSPFNAFENNPIVFKDDNGKDAEFTIKGNTITFNAKIVVAGEGITEKYAKAMQKDIMSHYKGNHRVKIDGKVYNVKFNITVTTKLEHVTPGTNLAYLRADQKEERGWVQGRNGLWNTNDKDTYGHEAGHFIGLSDRYIEVHHEASWFIPNDKTEDKTLKIIGDDDTDVMGPNARKSNSKISTQEVTELAKYALKNQKDGAGVIKSSTVNEPSSQEKLDSNTHGDEFKKDNEKKEMKAK